MIIPSITVLLEAWQEHQLTNRELITEARQLTPRTALSYASPCSRRSWIAACGCSSRQLNSTKRLAPM